MNRHAIEPGLLKVFRLFALVMWSLLALGFCGESADAEQTTNPATTLALIHASLLVILLTWRRVQRWMGRAFLPVALVLAWLGPVVIQGLATAARLDAGEPARVDSGSLLLWLLVPLLLVSSQYGMHVMVAFNLGAAALEVALFLLLSAAGDLDLDPILEELMIRLLLFSIVGYVVVRLTTAQRAQRRTLAEKNAQLAHYAATLEQLAVTRERNRMARELHDTLAHTLSAISVQLQALEVLLADDPQAARDTLAQVQHMARSGTQEARRVLHALRASPLEDLGLVLALERLAQSAANRAGLTLALHLPQRVADLRLDIEQHVFRIAEEALNNVVRHANARQLTLELRQHNGALVLRVADDGIGFDPAHLPPPEGEHANGQFGLTGMQERALLCGGTLTITSQPYHGTTITLTIEETA
jgi:signal transduction histidine kinase